LDNGVFHLTYLVQELRRRAARTILTALGLALGVGLVLAIIGVSQGLDDAQAQVLAPLKSVGTDILVTRVAGVTPTAANTGAPTTTTTTPPRASAGPGGGGQFFGGGPNGRLDRADAAALAAENSNVVTDLAKLGSPGDHFVRDFFLSATLISFPADSIAAISKVDGVTSASGGLVQLASHQSGTVPRIVASVQTGGQTFTQTVRPDPMTEAERSAFESCLSAKGVTIGAPPTPSAEPSAGGGAGGRTGGGGGRRGNPAFDECLPQRFREFRAQFTTPLQTIQQVVDPPSTDITSESYTAAGIDPTKPRVGLVTQEQLTQGRWLAKDAKNEVLLNVAYANTKSLAVGATLPINGTDYTVVGLVRPTLSGSTADVYFPLATLQELAGKPERVTQVLVKVSDAGKVDAVAAAIRKQLPGAEVITTKALADQVTGSLADARSLAGRLGGALAAIVLGGAFTIAVLLTLASISKRVREIGTLRAIGWSKGRVVRQLLGETLGIGLAGGVLGIGAGALIAAAVHAFSPTLTASSAGLPGIGSSTFANLFGQAATSVQTTQLKLSAPLSPSTMLLGVAMALAGGLLAGLVGGWRAARLAPAVALRDLG